jgi:hypothetical protein
VSNALAQIPLAVAAASTLLTVWYWGRKGHGQNVSSVTHSGGSIEWKNPAGEHQYSRRPRHKQTPSPTAASSQAARSRSYANRPGNPG